MGKVYVAVLAAALALLVIPALLLPVLLPDADAPAAIAHILPGAKRYLAGQLDLGPAHVRFIEAETRARDQLIILQFELWAFPTLTPEGAYLVSRCTPIDEIEPNAFGGGRGVSDFATDPELEHLRSDAQPACPG